MAKHVNDMSLPHSVIDVPTAMKTLTLWIDMSFCVYKQEYGLCQPKTDHFYNRRRHLVIECNSECYWPDLQHIKTGVTYRLRKQLQVEVKHPHGNLEIPFCLNILHYIMEKHCKPFFCEIELSER